MNLLIKKNLLIKLNDRLNALKEREDESYSKVIAELEMWVESISDGNFDIRVWD